MTADPLLPIKVVFPRKSDYAPPHGGGGEATVFGEVTGATREELVAQLADVQHQFAASFREFPDVPAVAKVTLKPEATAKSHRPIELFNDRTCPIIGANRLGELYVGVEPGRLERIAELIERGASKKKIANISTLKSIEPYGQRDALSGLEPSEHPGTALALARHRLFRHRDAGLNRTIDRAFLRLIKAFGLTAPELMHYAEGMSVYCLRELSAPALATLARFPGTQSLTPFPSYRLVRTASRVVGELTARAFPAPEPDRQYGVVGIIDSGTDPNNPYLQQWVSDRLDWVPRALQDNEHGSFVAGLLAHGRLLNHGDSRFPAASSRIVDVAALDANGTISEYDLVTVIDTAVDKFPDVKVWNLSLGLVGNPCSDYEVSLLAAKLDDIAKTRDVLFVVAAGNYAQVPLRTWPPQGGLGEEDRICPPADAVRAVTVGSLAHLDTPSTLVSREAPSPFSRRGPGPAYLIKPELSHYGGNCDEHGDYSQAGVISVSTGGQVAENVGTSFACPLVATLAANVHRELEADPEAASPSLVKALLAHGAFLRNPGVTAEQLNYVGIGRPPEVNEIVGCQQSAATMIIHAPIHSAKTFVKRPFPMPACLEADGALRGEVFMTLLYDPPLDRGFGIEYCRANVTASLGIERSHPKTGELEYKRQVHPVPKQLMEGYEEDLVQHGYKWSPLKLYYRRFSRAPANQTWRLTLELLNRAEGDFHEDQYVTLLLTIRDPLGEQNVYDTLVRDMNRLGWGAMDLQVRSRARLQS